MTLTRAPRHSLPGQPGLDDPGEKQKLIVMRRKKKFYLPPPCRRALNRGFTLLEVMIAMAILAIGLLVAFQSQSQSVAMMAASRATTMMTMLAQSKMAELETANIAALASANGDFGSDYPDYTWASQVTSEDVQLLKKIVLTVQNKRLKKGNAVTIVLYRFNN